MTIKHDESKPVVSMLAIVFSVVTLIVAVLGIIGVAFAGVGIASLGMVRLCFMIFLVMFYASLLLRIAKDV